MCIRDSNCEYEPEQFPGVVYRVVDPKLAILMFRSGRAVCTGGKNQANIETGIERMLGDLRAAGITTWDLKDVEIEVQNMVATYSLFFPEDYDGVAKNQTIIADGVFIGSGTQLVAPVKLGQNSYVAAGSCITDDVPSDALGIARSHQLNKENWVEKKRKSE